MTQTAPRDVELVAFDLGGTTIQDLGGVSDAFTTVLQAHGIQITAGELSTWRGASKRKAFEHFIARQFGDRSHERIGRVYADFCDRLQQQFQEQGVHPISGAAETFAWLRSCGIRLTITTGFDRATTDRILRAVGWDQGAVEAVVCGDDVPLGRPAPYMIFRAMEATGVVNVRRVATVGDTALDLEAGWNAGVGYNIGVLSGAHRLEQLQKVPHTHLLPSVAALPGLWHTES
jgi:phosphonatase-like hydrolase